MMLARYRHGKSLFALFLFSLALTALGCCRPHMFMALINPLDLGPGLFLALYLAKCLSLALIDGVIEIILAWRYKERPLPYRANTGALGLEKLEWIDTLYLGINSILEFIFSAQVFTLVLSPESTNMAWRPRDLTFLNTLPALYLIFAIDDFFYAPAHKLMHASWFYPYVHKHHHRQNLPTRGYLDAGNEHPVEQVIGLSCLWTALHIVAKITGLHALTIITHFLLYAVLALLNHTNYDVQFTFFGFEYSVRAHEMHHRYPQSNLAQYFMIWDSMLGTYKPYIDGSSSSSSSSSKQRSFPSTSSLDAKKVH